MVPPFNLETGYIEAMSVARVLSSTKSDVVLNQPEIDLQFESVVVSGTVSSEKNEADSNILSILFEKKVAKELKVVVDDLKFARKRLVTPKTVYSGLIDILRFTEGDLAHESSLKNSLSGASAWLAFNISSHDVKRYAALASELSLQRVVFVVRETAEDAAQPHGYNESLQVLADHNVLATILRFEQTVPLEESTAPFRVMRGELPVPRALKSKEVLAVGDLQRIAAEALDLPKTLGHVYGIGPGNDLDAEVQMYIKAQGWSRSSQVAVLLGSLMESVERRFVEAQQAVEAGKEKPAAAVAAATKSTGGFFV
eukprot:gene7715-8526_t